MSNIKKLKIQRLKQELENEVTEYETLLISAIHEQRYEDAVFFRDKQRTILEKITELGL